MNNISDEKYMTRYGVRTAAQAADDMLDRADATLSFLAKTLDACGESRDGKGFTLPRYSACGLAYILEDIAYNVEDAKFYLREHEHCPGKIGETLETRDE